MISGDTLILVGETRGELGASMYMREVLGREDGAPPPEDLSLEEAERVFIEKVLARHGGDVRLAAEQLGMSRSALYRRLQQYGVRE
jgi:DNA-binding NtrC family response regulator